MSDAEELCTFCGAPRVSGYAACKYCKTPFARGGGAEASGIPCPRCQTLNEANAQRCVQCQTWVVVQCVFCHALSPHNAPACLKCNEAFAGAPQRFAERQRAQHVQQGLNIAGTVGNVAASFLGAAAVAGVFSHHDHYEHHQHGGYGHHHGNYGPPPDDWNRNNEAGSYGRDDSGTGAGIAQSNESSGGSFFGSLFGGDSSSDSSGDAGTGAGISQSNDDGGSGGGILGSLFGGGSDDSGTGAGISQSDDGGSFFGGGDDDNS